MKKIKYIFGRLFNMDFKKMRQIIKKIRKKTKKNTIFIVIDIIYCGFAYMAGYNDYYLMEMYNMNRKQRKTILTRGKINKYIKAFNNKDYWHIIHNKNEFNRKFKKYIKRDWLMLDNNLTKFKKFIEDKETIIAKPKDGACGIGVRKIDTSNANAEELYNRLVANSLTILEEVVIQHKLLNEIHPNGVNTLRILTLNFRGNVTIMGVLLKMGNGKVVDNFNNGGILTPVNLKTGKITKPAINKEGEIYTNHPLTNKSIIGFEIPNWPKVCDFVKSAAKEVPEIGLIGWDVAITDKGPLLIEGNQYPTHDMHQLPAHLDNGIGLLPDFEKIVKLK